MRNLTVKRKWNFVECGSKIFLYVQCPKDDADCKIGEEYFKQFKLPNGKSVSAEISNDETSVYVTSSTMQASYTVPAGESDVNLVTSPKYAPMQGNPFTITEVK